MCFILTGLYDEVLIRVATRSVTVLNAAAVILTIWALCATILAARRKFKTTRLRGPPRTNLVHGVAKDLFESMDAGSIYEQCQANAEYGLVFEVPTTLGGNKIVLSCDPKATAHFYAKETWTYEYWLLLLLRCLQATGSASPIALGSISFLDRYFQPDFWKVLESQGTFQPAQNVGASLDYSLWDFW